MRQRIRTAMNSLQTRLTLTSTLVTVAALLALEIIVFIFLMIVMSIGGINKATYLLGVYSTLAPQAVSYFQRHDLVGLQTWVTERYASGFASDEPRTVGERAAAAFVPSRRFVVLDLEGTIVAQAPFEQEAIGQIYTPPDEIDPTWFADHATKQYFEPLEQYQSLEDGSWYLLVPVQTMIWEQVRGTIVLNVMPAPAFLDAYLPFFSCLVGITAVALLIGVTPLGALFGYIMARNMTRRLENLEMVAAAYSQGDFTAVPEDDSRDEIDRLGVRLQEMAQQIETLLQSRQELATLKERNRLARELHDTVKQQYFATLMQVRAAKNLTQQGIKTAVTLEHLETAEHLIKQSEQDLISMIEELRPSQLDGQGLPTALRQFTQSWSTQNGITINLSMLGTRALPLAIEQALYRVAQEAFANITRHSAASLVDVCLHYKPHSVSLTITDDGQGFDPQNVQRGFGLLTMRQRVAEINGQLAITSESGQGTVVMVKIEM